MIREAGHTFPPSAASLKHDLAKRIEALSNYNPKILRGEIMTTNKDFVERVVGPPVKRTNPYRTSGATFKTPRLIRLIPGGDLC